MVVKLYMGHPKERWKVMTEFPSVQHSQEILHAFLDMSQNKVLGGAYFTNEHSFPGLTKCGL